MVFTKHKDNRFWGGFRYTDLDGINWNWYQIRISYLLKGKPFAIKTEYEVSNA